MIESLYDSSTGTITEFPHILHGTLSATLSNGGTTLNYGTSGDEILKFDSQYVYIRDRYNSSDVAVYNENGYVKTVSISDVDL